MRSRQEIEEISGLAETGPHRRDAMRQMLTVELLLDVREILERIEKKSI